jgi:hypothetical protein
MSSKQAITGYFRNELANLRDFMEWADNFRESFIPFP